MIPIILLVVLAGMMLCILFMRFMFKNAQTLNRGNQYEEYVRDRRETRRRARSRRREEERLKNDKSTEGV